MNTTINNKLVQYFTGQKKMTTKELSNYLVAVLPLPVITIIKNGSADLIGESDDQSLQGNCSNIIEEPNVE